MSEQGQPELTEEQLRALAAERERIHVDDVLLQTIVSLINLGARKGAVGAPPEAGLTPDNEQLRIAIEAARALVTIVEPRHADQLAPFREALSQRQMHYARAGGAQPAEPQQDPQPQGGQGTAQGSGRLW